MASQASSTFDAQFKILLAGDMAVGKTAILLRFCDNAFRETFITTIGIDYKHKVLDISGKRIKLQVWDTAGQERFRNITVSYFRGAHGIVLVYDVSDRKTFENVVYWAETIKQTASDCFTTVLVGNKCDKKMVVSQAEGEAIAKRLGMKFFLASAKSDINVKEAFNFVAQRCVDKALKVPTPPPNPASVPVTADPRSSDKTNTKCC